MFKVRHPSVPAICVLLLVTTLPALAQQPPDSTLYTTFTIFSNFQMVNWVVCGSTQQSGGCYASGSLGPFNKVGALMEGNSTTRGNVVTRAIYLVDSGNASDVQLYVYKKTDTVSPNGDVVSLTLAKTVSLPLTGGMDALCSMGANNRFLFIGTDQSPQGIRVQKSDLSIVKLGGFSPPINVTAITADNYGYVTVTQGGFGGGESGFSVFGPDGFETEDGGGAPFMLNTRTAVVPVTLPQSGSSPAHPLGVRPKPTRVQTDQK